MFLSVLSGEPPPPRVLSLLLPLCKGLGGYLLLVFWWGWMAFTSLFIVYPPIIGNEGPVHIHSIIPFYYRDCVLGLTHWVLRWNSWTAFLAEVTGHKLVSFQTRGFIWFSNLIFLFYKILFMTRLEFSCFGDFFVRILKTRVEYAFRWNPPVEVTANSMEQKTQAFC